MLNAKFPGNEHETLVDYCVLVGMDKDFDTLVTDLKEVTDDATMIAEWIQNYLGHNQNSSLSKPAQAVDAMVINLDMRSDDDGDDDDGDQHHRRRESSNMQLTAEPAGHTNRKRQRNGLDHDHPAKRQLSGINARLGAPVHGNQPIHDDVTFTVTVNGSHSARMTEPPPAPVEVARCAYWPNCTRGESCSFFHPTATCPQFPNCEKGNQCRYIHPDGNGESVLCRFGMACTRAGCAFTHPPGMIRGGGGLRGRGAFGSYRGRGGYMSGAPHLAKVTCRFYPNCANQACPYFHPGARAVDGRQNGAGVTGTSSQVCKFEPLCSREDCRYAHPSRLDSPAKSTSHYKSTKFQEELQPDFPALSPTSSTPWMGGNKTLILHGNGAPKPHISERSFAVPEGTEVEKVDVPAVQQEAQGKSAV
ncbi:hypothetical protein HKX48_006502 [Thoreauomyces humboldtii]|nr:hypothetical protein HKX48_006502 [Thoreauomyces humboldtii]